MYTLASLDGHDDSVLRGPVERALILLPTRGAFNRARRQSRAAGGRMARVILRVPSFCANTSSAEVAQLVEHVTENHGVGGSIPPLGTIFP